MREDCDVNKTGESNESIFGRFDISKTEDRTNCKMVKIVKHRTLKWFNHLLRKSKNEMRRRIFLMTEADAIVGIRR